MSKFLLSNYTIVLYTPSEEIREFDSANDLAKSIGTTESVIRTSLSRVRNHRRGRARIVWDGLKCEVFFLKKTKDDMVGT